MAGWSGGCSGGLILFDFAGFGLDWFGLAGFGLGPDIAALLIGVGFVAGFVDAIAGGGGLITVPALLLCGLDPTQALATNKLQGCFGSGTAALTYGRAGHVDLQKQGWMAAVAVAASALGAGIALVVPADVLRAVMPVILIAVACYFALKPGLGDAARAPRLTPFVFGVSLVPVVALYDGFFGPGAGSFYMLGFVVLAGKGLLKATAHTKFLNFASNFGALMVFAFGGHILWGLGLAMAVAQVGGATLGARLAIRVGAGMIRPLLVVVCLALAIRLMVQNWG